MTDLFIYDGTMTSDSNGIPRRATAEEVMAAHPKCKTCQVWRASDVMEVSTGFLIGSCKYRGMEAHSGYYCPHHTSLTKETP